MKDGLLEVVRHEHNKGQPADEGYVFGTTKIRT